MPAIIIGIISMKMIEKALRVMRYMTMPMSSGTIIATIGIGFGLPRSGRSGTWNSWPAKSGRHARRARERHDTGVAREHAAAGSAHDAVALQVHLELGVADPHDVAALEVGARHLLTAGGDAVGGAEVDDLDDLLDDELGVLARDRLVGERISQPRPRPM